MGFQEEWFPPYNIEHLATRKSQKNFSTNSINHIFIFAYLKGYKIIYKIDFKLIIDQA